MKIECHFPERRTLSLDELLAGLPSREACAEPFADDSIAFCEAAAAVFASAPRELGPAWPAAAFFFRRAALQRMKQDLGGLRAPRGLVFHITPGNVDTQFVYSWLLSLLAGNANVVRISSKLASATIDVIHRIAVDRFPRVARGTRILSFGHHEEITGALSARCDMRVIWGGDEAIERIRTSPLRPDAKEITFPDRFSLALIGATAYAAMDEAAQRRVAHDFVNDVWVFDQMACSSPKALVWLGAKADQERASEAFFGHVLAALERSPMRVALVTAIEKMRFGFGTLADGRATRVRRFSNELVVVSAGDLEPLRTAHWGGGLVVETRIDDIGDLARLVHAGDQTLAWAALSGAELDAVARLTTRTGLCRIVPVGRALAFTRVWDGMDLPAEMTRLVVVEGREP